MSGLEWKMANRFERMAVSNGWLYGILRKHALCHSAVLPQSADSLEILQAVSRRPQGGLNVELRSWPERPKYDISIIVPCHNVERFVEDCVQSIITQRTSRSFEVICVDDGSTDATGHILDHFASQANAVRVIHQNNFGVSVARNVGIAEACGSRLMYVDSDDMLLPGALEILSEALDTSDCDYVTAAYMYLSQDGKTVTPLPGVRRHGGPAGRLYEREVWRNLEFPAGYWFEDTVQSFCIEPRWQEKYIDVPVYLYRQNKHSITHSTATSKKGLDTLWIVEELLEWDRMLDIPFDQEMYERVLWQFGPLLWERTAALSRQEHLAMFAHASGILAACNTESRYSTMRQGHWGDVERGLKERNYGLWKLAILGCWWT